MAKNLFDVSGKVVAITGAGGVICGTMAKALGQVGAKVAVLDLNEDAAKSVAAITVLSVVICSTFEQYPDSKRHPRPFE
jgi:NAD(P)-dependent dehydrogenase (short-subunit alcohol dehydrogenase family)